MKAVILNGNSPGHPGLDDYIQRLRMALLRNSWEVEVFNLAAMNLHYCTGCWACWWKTPGRCAFTDDMEQIYPGIVTADLLISAAPMSMGFVHSNLKKVIDRIIPAVLPYIGLYQGECHHYLRYQKSPALGVLLEKEPDTDLEDLEIVTACFKRLSLNFRNRLVFTKTTETPLEEVLNEINSL